MKIIAIRQNKNGLNEFFITDTYDEFSLDELISIASTGKIQDLVVATRKNGTKYLKSTANKNREDNLEICTLMCREEDYLLFDLHWLYLKAGGNGHVKKKWAATSGIPGSGPADQHRKDYGPLPEGEYTVRLDKTIDIETSKNLFDTLKWLIKSPTWGLIVTPLDPNSKNKMSGRNAFTIHGGNFPGSEGCIDLTSNNKDFHVSVRLYKRNFKLIVRYK